MVSQDWAAVLCELALGSVPQRPPGPSLLPPAGLGVPGKVAPLVIIAFCFLANYGESFGRWQSYPLCPRVPATTTTLLCPGTP